MSFYFLTWNFLKTKFRDGKHRTWLRISVFNTKIHRFLAERVFKVRTGPYKPRQLTRETVFGISLYSQI
jgi:hypothetical protein